MRNPLRGRAGLVLVALAATGCTNQSVIKEVHELDGGRVLLTSADVRSVTQVAVGPGTVHGRVSPSRVTCAEPSPDVAKALAASFGAGLSVSPGAAVGGGGAGGAASISQAKAESLAQLGERLGTIQLLRDALYRACEAYANGAISSTAYAVLLSRIDDTIVTLMGSEMAAGAFGRTLAGIGTEAESQAKAAADLQAKRKDRQSSIAKLQEKRSERREVEAKLSRQQQENREIRTNLEMAKKRQGEAQANVDNPPANSNATELQEQLDESKEEVAKTESALEQNNKEVATSEGELSKSRQIEEEAEAEATAKMDTESEAATKAVVQVGGGITPGQQKPEIARILEDFQKNYVENINGDAIIVACVAALDSGVHEDNLTALGKYCRNKDVLMNVVKGMQEVFKEVLKHKLEVRRLGAAK